METDKNINDKNADKHVVSEEDKRNVAEMIAKTPLSVSTNHSTGEVITVYRDGRVVKSTIAPNHPIITKADGKGVVKIESKMDLGDNNQV